MNVESENYDKYIKALTDLKRIVLRLLSSELAECNAYYDAELEYCEDNLIATAKELVELCG